VFLLKLFFGDFATPDELLEHVRRRRREAEELAAELEQIGARSCASGDDFYPALTRRYGLAWAGAITRWAREVERELQARVNERAVR
jgi:hypothetical protein